MQDPEDERWMRAVFDEAARAVVHKEIPVAAILVAAGREISRAQTMGERHGSKAAHAELTAILQAKTRLRTPPRPLVLYTNLEPCLMCVGAAMQVGVDEIVFSVAALPDGGVRYLELPVNGLKPPLVRGGVCEEAGLTLFRQFLAWKPDTSAADYIGSVLAAYGNGGTR